MEMDSNDAESLDLYILKFKSDNKLLRAVRVTKDFLLQLDHFKRLFINEMKENVTKTIVINISGTTVDAVDGYLAWLKWRQGGFSNDFGNYRYNPYSATVADHLCDDLYTTGDYYHGGEFTIVSCEDWGTHTDTIILERGFYTRRLLIQNLTMQLKISNVKYTIDTVDDSCKMQLTLHHKPNEYIDFKQNIDVLHSDFENATAISVSLVPKRYNLSLIRDDFPLGLTPEVAARICENYIESIPLTGNGHRRLYNFAIANTMLAESCWTDNAYAICAYLGVAKKSHGSAAKRPFTELADYAIAIATRNEPKNITQYNDSQLDQIQKRIDAALDDLRLASGYHLAECNGEKSREEVFAILEIARNAWQTRYNKLAAADTKRKQPKLANPNIYKMYK